MASNAYFDFGKFNGRLVRDVPDYYLQWVLKTLDPFTDIFKQCSLELKRRKHRPGPVLDAADAWLQSRGKKRKKQHKKASPEERAKNRADRKRWAMAGYNDDGQRVVQDGQFAGWPLVNVREKLLHSSLAGLLSEEQITALADERRQLIAADKERQAAKSVTENKSQVRPSGPPVLKWPD